MAEFHPSYPVAGLRGADYNPRRINPDSLARLSHSLATLGICKPIIVSGDLIVAGHQRTRTLRALGRTHAPAVLLPSLRPAEEIRFNQLHNGTDFDSGDEDASVGPGVAPLTYEMVPAAAISGNMRARMAGLRNEICRLLTDHGNWGGCVATMSGTVIHAAQYALACKATGIPARVYRIQDGLETEARTLLSEQYGVFSYDHIDRKTYVQTFAQLSRLREGKGKALGAHKSTLYESRVLPELKPGERLLDFGCGQGDYVKALQARGAESFGIEFFYRSGSSIDGPAVHRMIDAAAAHIGAHGLFDVVVCDSVLNSVDSLQAEADVLACVNAFCRPGGRIYASGRSREFVDSYTRRTQAVTKGTVRYVEFLDEHGFSGLYRNGSWFFQKFHTKAQAESLAAAYIGETATYKQPRESGWSIAGTKTVELPEAVTEATIAREFDLIWPGGRTVGRADHMMRSMRIARSAPPRTANSDKS